MWKNLGSIFIMGSAHNYCGLGMEVLGLNSAMESRHNYFLHPAQYSFFGQEVAVIESTLDCDGNMAPIVEPTSRDSNDYARRRKSH